MPIAACAARIVDDWVGMGPVDRCKQDRGCHGCRKEEGMRFSGPPGKFGSVGSCVRGVYNGRGLQMYNASFVMQSLLVVYSSSTCSPHTDGM